MKSWSDVIDLDQIGDLYEDLENNSRDVVFPFKDELLKALEIVPYHAVKVCILGQDPYHGFLKTDNTRIIPQANGLAFSVDRGLSIPPSLRNIFKELKNDLGIPTPKHGDLTKWAEQGVLLLNSVLTVEAGSPASHSGKGWEKITGDIIRALTSRKKPVYFLLWGKKAYETYMANVNEDSPLFFMRAAHPSPYSAEHGFFGCKHFSAVNEWLVDAGEKPIDWSLDG